MARPLRQIVAGGIYHVLNRGNAQRDLFNKDGDFHAVLKILGQGMERYPVDLFCYCLMSNHWHLVIRPQTAAALARFMQWVGVTHVRRHHAHYRTQSGGHLYQGRFKGFPIQEDRHFLTVCRYVEANPLRAGLVRRAEEWPWSSLGAWMGKKSPISLAKWPVTQPGQWVETVNEIMPRNSLAEVRTSVNRGRPFGEESWQRKTAAKQGLLSTLQKIGRPKKGETR